MDPPALLPMPSDLAALSERSAVAGSCTPLLKVCPSRGNLSTPQPSQDFQSRQPLSGKTPIGFPSTPVNMILSPPPTASPSITPLSSNHEGLDELDLLLCHEDFPKLVYLAAQLKILHLNGSKPRSAHQRTNGSPPHSSGVVDAVTRLQENLMSASAVQQNHLAGANEPLVVTRGAHPITDSLIDDSLATLRQDFDRCSRLIDSIPASVSPQRKQKKSTASSSKGEGIMVKYSKWQTDALMRWMIEHIQNPFPDPEDVHELMHQTNLSFSQIINWTTNVRKRNRKATIEDGKKPHHFIDFLFLAQKRDEERHSTRIVGNRTPESQSVVLAVTTPSRINKPMHNATDTSPMFRWDVARASDATMPFPESPADHFSGSHYHHPHGLPSIGSGSLYDHHQSYWPSPQAYSSDIIQHSLPPHAPPYANDHSYGRHSYRVAVPSPQNFCYGFPPRPSPNKRGHPDTTSHMPPSYRQSPHAYSSVFLSECMKDEPEFEHDSPDARPSKKSRCTDKNHGRKPHHDSITFPNIQQGLEVNEGPSHANSPINQELAGFKLKMVSSFDDSSTSSMLVSFGSTNGTHTGSLIEVDPPRLNSDPIPINATTDSGMLRDFVAIWEMENDDNAV